MSIKNRAKRIVIERKGKQSCLATEVYHGLLRIWACRQSVLDYTIISLSVLGSQLRADIKNEASRDCAVSIKGFLSFVHMTFHDLRLLGQDDESEPSIKTYDIMEALKVRTHFFLAPANTGVLGLFVCYIFILDLRNSPVCAVSLYHYQILALKLHYCLGDHDNSSDPKKLIP